MTRVDSPTTWSAYYRVIYATNPNLYRRCLTGCSVCCRRSSDCLRLASLAARDAAIVPAKVERRIVDRWATCTTPCHPGSVRLLFARLSTRGVREQSQTCRTLVTGRVLAFRAGARVGGFRKGTNSVSNSGLRDSDGFVLDRCRNGNVTFCRGYGYTQKLRSRTWHNWQTRRTWLSRLEFEKDSKLHNGWTNGGIPSFISWPVMAREIFAGGISVQLRSTSRAG